MSALPLIDREIKKNEEDYFKYAFSTFTDGSGSEVETIGEREFTRIGWRQMERVTAFLLDGEAVQKEDYFDVIVQLSVPTQREDGSSFDKTTYIYYDVDRDDWNMKGREYFITRQDARMLSQIATKINPDSKYRQPAAHFDIQGTLYLS